jgi:hypothetical protein
MASYGRDDQWKMPVFRTRAAATIIGHAPRDEHHAAAKLREAIETVPTVTVSIYGG